MDFSRTVSIQKSLYCVQENFRDFFCVIINAGLSLGLVSGDYEDFGDWVCLIISNFIGMTFITRLILEELV
ncbi:NADP-dependent 3-hydroxy acid dehydrogenase, partial [Neisseria sp. P0006.S004]